jgi:transcription elongation GreA/GreB family factor
MSRAFTKEPEPGAPSEPLPERPVSDHVASVTQGGLAQLTGELETLGRRGAELLAQLSAGDLPADEEQLAREELRYVDRDLRYFDSRIESAQLVDLGGQPRHEVAFGATVTVAVSGGRPGAASGSGADTQTWTIVGEDEADPDGGKVSYVSPLAVALLGTRVGEKTVWRRPAGPLRLIVQRISYDR